MENIPAHVFFPWSSDRRTCLRWEAVLRLYRGVPQLHSFPLRTSEMLNNKCTIIYLCILLTPKLGPCSSGSSDPASDMLSYETLLWFHVRCPIINTIIVML